MQNKATTIKCTVPVTQQMVCVWFFSFRLVQNHIGVDLSVRACMKLPLSQPPCVPQGVGILVLACLKFQHGKCAYLHRLIWPKVAMTLNQNKKTHPTPNSTHWLTTNQTPIAHGSHFRAPDSEPGRDFMMDWPNESDSETSGHVRVWKTVFFFFYHEW